MTGSVRVQEVRVQEACIHAPDADLEALERAGGDFALGRQVPHVATQIPVRIA